MRDKFYRCPKCGKITRHIKLSEREFAAMRHESNGMVFGAGVFDTLGGTAMMNNVFGLTHYKCSECGTPFLRNGAGVDCTENEGKVSLLENMLGTKFPWSK